jgi:hypothetical protein
MSRRRGAATAAALALFAVWGLASPARAQHVEGRAAVVLTGAYTRSWSDSPRATSSNFEGPSIALSPVLAGYFDTPRTENALSYALSLSAPYLRQGDAVDRQATYANRLLYAGHYALAEHTSMTFSAAFTESPLNAFVASQDPSAAPIQAIPAGDGTMVALNVGEGLSHQVTERTTILQSAAFAYGAPLGVDASVSHTITGQNTLGWSRSFLYDRVGMTFTTQANRFTAAVGVPDSSVYVGTLALDYTHDFTESLHLSLTPGVTATVSPGGSRSSVVEPSGSVSLGYEKRFGAAALVFAHQALPDLATGTVDFDDMATLRFVVPIGTTGLHTAGTAGFMHSTPIQSSAAQKLGPVNVGLGDLSLDYAPPSARRFAVGFRGQFMRELADANPTASVTRYTLALSLTYAYPSATIRGIRPTLAPVYDVHAPTQTEIVSSDRVPAP